MWATLMRLEGWDCLAKKDHHVDVAQTMTWFGQILYN